MAVVAGVAFAIVLTIDTTSTRAKRAMDRRMLIRIVIMMVIVVTLYLIPEKVHIPFIYRKYREFVKYYEEHQRDGAFPKIFNEFRHNNPESFE